MQRSAKCISISAGWQDVDELYSALPSLCLSPRCPASHLVYGPFLAAALHRNPRHQRQQLAIHALSGQLERKMIVVRPASMLDSDPGDHQLRLESSSNPLHGYSQTRVTTTPEPLSLELRLIIISVDGALS